PPPPPQQSRWQLPPPRRKSPTYFRTHRTTTAFIRSQKENKRTLVVKSTSLVSRNDLRLRANAKIY
ncbi:MAG: hypothetical protein LBF86_03460, partial [Helicobacteraceae bacterium]|nr:hypothetical protein [Helicobacteraceae bacterium]